MPKIRQLDGLHEITEKDWNNLSPLNNPFLSYSFLYGLEKFDCLKQQYWHPKHLILEENNQVLAAIPLYEKQDSYGEFVFDWAWADAYHQAGRAYYPKLVSAIPFTPVSGERILSTRKNEFQNKMIDSIQSIVHENQMSSAHILFPEQNDITQFLESDWLERITIQFHWHNQGYRDFQDFTDNLTSKKRKTILHERKKIKTQNIEIERLSGSDITEEHWKIFYEFYCLTFYKKWGEPRFTLDFFIWLGQTIPEQTVLILAKRNDEYVAGAFAMQDEHTLYGRHWGCKTDISFLHFELCYYQTIEHVIEKGLNKLDAGVQGEHKLSRGFQPVAMSSAHWIREKDFRGAIANYLKRETAMLDEHIVELKAHLPYKETT